MAVTPLQLTEQDAKKQQQRRPLIFDPLLMLAAIGLLGCSLLTMKGAKPGEVVNQAAYGAIGLVACVLVSRIDYTRWREYRYFFYGLLIVSNIVVYAMPSTLGASRWIPLPFFNIQPSEFGKLLLILALAAFVVDRSRKESSLRLTGRILIAAIVPAVIVIGQPDLGTGLVYMTICAAMLYFGGTSWKQLLALAVIAILGIGVTLGAGPAVGVHLLKPYQSQRLTTFLDPPKVCGTQDQTCYQLQQGEIAIGAGRKTGQGVKGATQINGLFVPEAQNDFVFAAVGDIYGFAGAALVLSLYALLIWRALRILTMAKNLFGTLIAGGILAMLMFQVFLNVGMTIGVMPVTGVPLPLLSYGGSSMLVTFLAVGLLQSIYIQSRIAATNKAKVLVV